MTAGADHGGGVDFGALYARLDAAEQRLAGDEQLAPERRRAVLDARARAIAQARDDRREETLSALVFRVGGERYAVAADEVTQVLECSGVAPVPGAPRWLLGLLVARARVVPVLDLRQLLGLDGGGVSDLASVVVVDDAGDVFGVAAELLEGRVELPRSALERPPAGPFRWVGPERLAVLDVTKLGTGTPGPQRGA